MSAGRKNNTNKKDWNTPPKYINPIKNFFGGSIDLDPCSNIHSFTDAKKQFIYPFNDGLKDRWDGNNIFVNPPYGRDKGKSLFDWFSKAIIEYEDTKQIIFLVPVATNTRHFKDIVFKQFSAICFLSDTRLRFYNEGVEDMKGAPMACCLCYKGHNLHKFMDEFSPYGKVFCI